MYKYAKKLLNEAFLRHKIRSVHTNFTFANCKNSCACKKMEWCVIILASTGWWMLNIRCLFQYRWHEEAFQRLCHPQKILKWSGTMKY